MNYAHLIQMRDCLKDGRYSSMSSNARGRLDVKPPNRECDTCGRCLPNHIERWKTKCYRCYRLFKEGALPKVSESKVQQPEAPSRSEVDDNWVLVADRKKVKHLDKIRLRQEKEQTLKIHRARKEAESAQKRAEQRVLEEQIEQQRKLQIEAELRYWNLRREADERQI